MSFVSFIDMRTLITSLEQRHRVLRRYCVDECERLELDARVRDTVRRALATITLYEEDPVRERAAIGAMYEACESGLTVLAILGSLRPLGDAKRTLADAIRDLQTLISALFEWAVPIAATPSPAPNAQQ